MLAGTGPLSATAAVLALDPKEKGGDLPSSFPDSSPHQGTSQRKLRIVLAEDNMGDVRLVREALIHHQLDAELILHRDGEEMLRYIERIESGKAPRPDVMLLDLNLPRQSGEAVLKRVRFSEFCADIPVVIVSSSNAPSDRKAASISGATRYFHKPSEFDAFMRLGEVIREVTGSGNERAAGTLSPRSE